MFVLRPLLKLLAAESYSSCPKTISSQTIVFYAKLSGDILIYSERRSNALAAELRHGYAFNRAKYRGENQWRLW